ncbi:MAG: hypothetical protein BroJett018_31630 [Chloroflexota bacterium]|nr:hypothetical protein [Chloroflexota bacterium]NOG66273.1 hypothetical protein [Chloroflexota bacterium]GIK65369.1 MAG: hypothetical protein BroJett018_31630 [Chloroflexota bacterium]
MKKSRWFLMLLLASLLLIAVPIVVGQEGSSNISAPKVIDTNPLPGEELLLDSPVTFTFDRVMNTEAPENAFSVEPALDGGAFTWDESGRTLTFTPPASGYARDTEYTFSLFAVGADQRAMDEPYELKLTTVGYIEIADVLPAPNSAEIEVDAAITIIFSRPIVPLVSIADQANLPSPITLEPAAEGKGEWLNTSIYVFRPDPPLSGGTTYTVTVSAGLEDVNGAILNEPYIWDFTTQVPEVQSVSPRNSTSSYAANRNQDLPLMPLEPEYVVTFTQPMDPTTQNGIRIEGPQVPTLEYEWSEDHRSVTVTTSGGLLQLDTLYDVIVDSTIIRSESGASIPEDYLVSFITVPYPSIVRTYPENGAEGSDPYGGMRIYFSAPIDQDTLEGKFTIEPEPWREYETYYYTYDNSYALYFDTEPSTDYTVTIAPGIADPYGNVINETTVIQYRTAPYSPELTLNTPGFVGLYNAYLPQTRLFITHRNIEQLEMQLYGIDVPTLAMLTGPNGWERRQDYTPDPTYLLRSWQFPVESQLNQRRYDLALLSLEGASGIENIVCVGAPPTRLNIGYLARVSEDDPTPLRVRSEPNLGGTVVTEYAPGTEVVIEGGPICADNYLWWQILNPADGVTGWMAEGNTSVYFIEPVTTPSPIHNPDGTNADQLPPLPPGVYYLRVESPQTRALEYEPSRHILVVATANITMKFTPKQAMAWVTDMSSGQPIEGVPVTFYYVNPATSAFDEIGMATSNADGIAQVNIPRLQDLYQTIYSVIDTPEHFGYVISDFSSGVEPWSFGLNGNYQPSQMSIYLNTDRPLYRPGQPVYFRGIIRDRDDVTYTLPDGIGSVPVKVYDNQSQIIYETEARLTEFGTFSGQFDLDEGAGLGYYRIAVEFDSEDPRFSYNSNFSIGFSVAEYRAPEFQTLVTPAASEVAQGETIQVEVESRYFFGAPVSNAKITWAVVGENYYFPYDGPGSWQFIDYSFDEGAREYYSQEKERIADGEGTTDDQGRFLIELPADLGEKTQSQVYTLEAVTTDESDQAVAGRTQIIIHQGRVYVGLASDEYVATAGDETGFQVLTVDWDSEPVAGQVVDYRIVERRWSSVQEKDSRGQTVWTYEVEEIEADSGSVTTDDDGLAHITFVPPNGGVFKIYAVTNDADGNRVNSSAYMWVAGSDYVPWRQQNSNRIDLISDKDNYKVDEVAEILIASPFQGESVALVTVERGDILQTEVVHMDTNSYVYRLPITENFAPNIYVSVIVVKGLDENTPYTQFRAGLIQLGVETERLAMNVQVTPDLPEGATAGPGDTVTLNVKTTDWQGNPVSAEVGVGVTDLAVLSIAAPNSGPLMQYFYGEQGLSTRTSTSLTVSVDQLTQEIIDTIKGGGGGGDEAGIFEVRQEFVDTPLWNPTVVTDANGEAQIEVTLPDNLTTWRIDARGVTSGENGPMLVGQVLEDFISTKPLLVRPVTPRFMVVGDKLTLGVIVNNNTQQDQEVEVLMQGTGFNVLEDTPLSTTVTIPAGGRVRVDWPVQALDVSNVDVTFAARTTDGSLSDASKPPVGQGDDRLLPVYKYVVPENVGTAGTLEGPDALSFTEVIALPDRIDTEQGQLDIRLDRSLAGPMLDGLDFLRNYPYQCIEQTVSKFLPNVMTMRALVSLNQSNPELEANLQTQVNYGLQRLYAEQKYDGGWGWFPRDDSNPLTTAYALIALVEAQNSGFTVDETVINRAKNFLRDYLLLTDQDVMAQSAPNWQLNRRAFILYAFTRAGEANASRISRVYDLRERLNLDAKAFLAMSMMTLDPADPRIETLMSDFANAATLSATGTHWEDRPDYYNWTTNTRTTALILMAMVMHDPSNDLLPGAVRWMMVARKADAWETTQETAWAVMSLTNWMVTTGELNPDYTFNVRLNDGLLDIPDNMASPENAKEHEVLSVAVAELLTDEANRLTLIKDEGPGNLYYTAQLRTFLDVPSVEPASRGIIIERRYYRANDPDKTPITSAHVGEEIVVELTIIAPRNLHYVVIEDPIPAGSDAVDPNLLTTSILSDGPELERDDPLSRGWGWWWFSQTEFRDEKVVMYATYLPPGTYTYSYTLRMGLAGEYNVIPPTGFEFYFPEVYGRGAGLLFTIETADPNE